MAVIFEDVEEFMNIFVDMHGRVDKPIGTISFENVLRTKDTDQEQQTLMKEACPSVLTHQKEMFSHMSYEFVACYMEKFNNQNLQLMMGCELRNEDDDKSMSILNMGYFLPKVSFQPTLSSNAEDCYFQ